MIYLIAFLIMGCAYDPQPFSVDDTGSELEIEDTGSGSDFEIEDTGSGSELEIEDTGAGSDFEIEDTGSGSDLEIEDTGAGSDLEIEDTGSGSDLDIEDTEIPICDYSGDGCETWQSCETETVWICPLSLDSVNVELKTYGSQWLLCRKNSSNQWICPTEEIHRECLRIEKYIGFGCSK